MIDTIRPEFQQAVEASRVNLWLVPLFFSAPLIVLAPVLRRWHWVAISALTLIAGIATWVSFFAYSETIWRTMEAHAETTAELEEVASDTGRVFGPFLLGTPFALIYAVLWLGTAFVLRAITRKFRRPDLVGPLDPKAEY